MGKSSSDWAQRMLSILRIIIGFLFLWHGSQKLFDYPAPSSGGGRLMIVAGILEFFGGLAILIGLFTRQVAFILSGLMAVAYFMAHASGGFLPFVNKGELAVIYCFVFLYLAVAGGGEWSVDKIWKR